MALIELDQLLGCSVDELIALVKPMPADNCEQYARAISIDSADQASSS
jgi:hypothetical protein